MQKGNPPMHLLVSTSGDFLRCRLTSMGADSLNFETRLENAKVPRSLVGCIIWLHDWDGPKPPSSPQQAPPGLRIQAAQTDGIRLTFVPRECDGTMLAGTSDVLGECRVRLGAVDQLIIGPTIRQAAEEQRYGSWKLHDAIEPEFARDAAGGEKSSLAGADSILLGKPAPDFQLDLLDGQRFKLSEQKGNLVVLEFWASWCGQCMQTMPDIDKVTSEFKDRRVKFIAVNMQEDQASITSALERLRIKPIVALDVDGAAAERYQVSAIPQIVVIDPQTNVAALLIGGNPATADELRTAIQKSLSPSKAN
jgi:thiol-disulfide isomerase/thioredoxin